MSVVIARPKRPTKVEVSRPKNLGGRFLVTVHVEEAGGRRRYRQKFPRRADADAYADSIRLRVRAELPPFATPEETQAPPPVVTVLDVLLAYKSSERGDQHVEAIRKTKLASMPAEGFGLHEMEAFLEERGHLKTCSKDFSFLKRALRYAKAKDVIARHYFEKLEGDKETRRRLMPAYKISESPGREIPDGNLALIFAKLNPRARAAVLFARATGSRLGEVAALDWQAHWSADGFRPIVQKGCRPRLVTNDPAIVGPRGIGLVFGELGASKETIEARLQACWRYAVKAAKVPHYRFHDLRHTFGTRLRREGKTFSDIAAIMGITEAMAHVYAHEDTERIQRESFQPATILPLLEIAKIG